MKIQIKTIPHKCQLYKTVGNYYNKNGTDHVFVSDMKNEDYAFLVAVHELVEMWLCRKRGIKEEDITAFDVQFEKDREAGQHSDAEEPGFDPKAPYVKEHTFATKIEKMVAAELGVEWDKYNDTVMSL